MREGLRAAAPPDPVPKDHPFLHPPRDSQGRVQSDAHYDQTTLMISDSEINALDDYQRKYWTVKRANFDKILVWDDQAHGCVLLEACAETAADATGLAWLTRLDIDMAVLPLPRLPYALVERMLTERGLQPINATEALYGPVQPEVDTSEDEEEGEEEEARRELSSDVIQVDPTVHDPVEPEVDMGDDEEEAEAAPAEGSSDDIDRLASEFSLMGTDDPHERYSDPFKAALARPSSPAPHKISPTPPESPPPPVHPGHEVMEGVEADASVRAPTSPLPRSSPPLASGSEDEEDVLIEADEDGEEDEDEEDEDEGGEEEEYEDQDEDELGSWLVQGSSQDLNDSDEYTEADRVIIDISSSDDVVAPDNVIDISSDDVVVPSATSARRRAREASSEADIIITSYRSPDVVIVGERPSSSKRPPKKKAKTEQGSTANRNSVAGVRDASSKKKAAPASAPVASGSSSKKAALPSAPVASGSGAGRKKGGKASTSAAASGSGTASKGKERQTTLLDMWD
ncbi:hypothetical protein DFH06DRAFT_89050 [Mycena polygramma]|nr:hypothetical protein DFH06DRAFT_89050 [Mycena polygramma]